MCFVFFFSSRRRHTRFDCDWSSDVCSSDLYKPEEPQVRMPMLPFDERVQSFQVIENGYDKAGAEKEAARCLQCVCPDVGRCRSEERRVGKECRSGWWAAQ